MITYINNQRNLIKTKFFNKKLMKKIYSKKNNSKNYNGESFKNKWSLMQTMIIQLWVIYVHKEWKN